MNRIKLLEPLYVDRGSPKDTSITLEQVEATVQMLRDHNVHPDLGGYYAMRVHPLTLHQARRALRRLKYRGGRKYRATVRLLRRNEMLCALCWVSNKDLVEREVGW